MHRHLWRERIASEILPVAIAAIFLSFAAIFITGLARPSAAQDDTGDSSDDYQQAVAQASHPRPRFVSTSLERFKFDHPVSVVTWTKSTYLASYKKSDPVSIPADLWVTEVPYLKAFCQEWVRTHGSDADQLALRLRQRLGLPPNDPNDIFVELTVDPKDNDKMFRPCDGSSLDSGTCGVPHLPAPGDPSMSGQQQEWLLRNYYASFATNNPYPWTDLGYTFDWARNDDTGDFVRYGESEFVIPANTPVHYVSDAGTAAYCAP